MNQSYRCTPALTNTTTFYPNSRRSLDGTKNGSHLPSARQNPEMPASRPRRDRPLPRRRGHLQLTFLPSFGPCISSTWKSRPMPSALYYLLVAICYSAASPFSRIAVSEWLTRARVFSTLPCILPQSHDPMTESLVAVLYSTV